MNVTARIRKQPRILLEFSLAALLIVWRCFAPIWHPLVMDIPFLLGLYWILLLFVSKAEPLTNLMVLCMLGLLGIYLKGQMAHVLVVVNLLP